MVEIVKVNDTTVAEIRESRALHTKQQLLARKINLETRLEQVNELLAIFD